ncbi:MAG: energy transducer TonB, partial [Acidobacteriota bacterium]
KEAADPVAATQAKKKITEASGQEKAAAAFRQTEPIRTQQAAPKAPSGNGSAAPAPRAISGGSDGASPSFSIAMPEAPGLLASLTASLKNFGDAFSSGKKGDYQQSSDFQFLLQEESLGSRFARELGLAWTEFRRNPKQFVGEFVRGEGSNRFRRNALLAGSEMALVAYLTLYFIGQIFGSLKKPNGILINGFIIGAATYLAACYAVRGFLLYRLINHATGKLAVPKVILECFNWLPVAALLLFLALFPNYNLYCLIFPSKCVQPEEIQEIPIDVTMIDTSKIDVKLPESAKAKEKMIGGSKSQPKPASGGGGGGRNEPTPPSKGVPPQMALTPQIIMPDPNPPKIKNPTLVVASTIYGDPKAMPPMKGPIGDPNGIPAPPSSGPGSGAGIGRGAGTGVGGGQGGGAGPGRGGNTGGGDMGIGGGRSIEPMSGSLRPNILYKEKAKYTEDARTNKITGTVVLNLVFNANGTISDIRIVRGLPDGLSESAIEAAKKMRFTAAVKNGQPVSVRGNVEFNFTLY